MKVFPVYKFMQGAWGQREYLMFATSEFKAMDFAMAWNKAHPESNGTFLAVSLDDIDPHQLPFKPDTYRGWSLDFEYGYHTALHDNYDASWEGEEDGWVDNNLRLTERTLPDLITEIDLHDESTPMSFGMKSGEVEAGIAGYVDLDS
jgi:hypothetical protein